ncbi:MAG: site-specific DNA-methyltransferase [Xenococcaceae cyanobacterium MO_167.B52]|nr:site-specific DNA-methyltransferase [Xenococcaceae cyanobacterium MO_167.B52]
MISKIGQFKIAENKSERYLSRIKKLDLELKNYYSNKFKIAPEFDRKIVSFQGNKNIAFYRWYKYKEAFSAKLVESLVRKYCGHTSLNSNSKIILDPFAGIGTTLFSCSELGFEAQGIELLPVGQNIIETNILTRNIQDKSIIDRIKHWQKNRLWNKEGEAEDFQVLPITENAYPQETEYKIKRYLSEIKSEIPEVQGILLFALLCILESISYTRKDGQYLRWDRRSGRSRGNFNKGKILSFDEAIMDKLDKIIQDVLLEDTEPNIFKYLDNREDKGEINILKGSCLDILPSLPTEAYEGIITSPPYCNRYDYTRTYALEHALLNVNNKELSSLRQAMLSCTVENKEKDLLTVNSNWSKAIYICDCLPLLQEIINYLNYKKEQKELNNKGIARMVKNYFYEMACVIQECYRVLEKEKFMCVANDNVRYAGASISVDLILSKIAEDIGFEIENIFVLPKAKGNSSQQMDRHGKTSLRKCIYIWKKK